MPIQTNALIRTAMLAGLAILAAQEARAAEVTTRTVVVDPAGLKLASPAGEAQLRAQVVAAIHRACGTADARDQDEMTDMMRCRVNARQYADAQIEAVLASARAETKVAAVEVATFQH